MNDLPLLLVLAASHYKGTKELYDARAPQVELLLAKLRLQMEQQGPAMKLEALTEMKTLLTAFYEELYQGLVVLDDVIQVTKNQVDGHRAEVSH